MQFLNTLLLSNLASAAFEPALADGNKQIVLTGNTFAVDITTAFTSSNATEISWVATESGTEIGKGAFPILDADTGFPVSKASIDKLVLPNTGLYTVLVEFKEGNSTEIAGKVNYEVRTIPGFVSLIPVILTLIVAFWTHQVLIALFLGTWISLSIVRGGNIFFALLDTVDTIIVKALADADHIKIVLFSWFLSAMVALIVQSGGALGLAELFKNLVSNRYTAQWATLGLGIVIFFDDYASALIVGHNMRLITDAVQLSHEKLAFIVHSTAAGPASIFPVTSWIGFELGLIKESLPKDYSLDAFTVFLSSVPSRFYPFFVLFLIAYSAGFKRDFGPMLFSERRAKKTGMFVPANDSLAREVNGDDEEPLLKSGETEEKKPEGRAFNAIIPLLFMIISVAVGLYLDGHAAVSALPAAEQDFSASNVFGSGNSYDALIWSSFGSVVIAIILYLVQGIMTLNDCMDTFVAGVKDITEALLVLSLAWSISSSFKTIGVPEFVVGSVGGIVSTTVLPSMVFLISCIISFATGTSWGTMSIVFPLAIPLALDIGGRYSFELTASETHTVVLVVSAILTGSIFGDQCSPISDTSILSALSSKISVVRHVESQLPYALMCAVLAFIAYFAAAGLSVVPSIVFTVIFGLVLGGFFFVLSSKVDSDDYGIIDRFFAGKDEVYEVKEKTIGVLPVEL